MNHWLSHHVWLYRCGALWAWLLVAVVCVPAVYAQPAPRALQYTIDSSLKVWVNVSGAELDHYLRSVRPNSPLIGLGKVWVAEGRKYGINPLYLMAHAIHESGWGLSRLARTKHNIYAWRAYNHCAYSCATKFRSITQCISTVVPLINRRYLTPGGAYYTRHGPTLRGMNVRYATDRNWKYAIAKLMNRASTHITQQRARQRTSINVSFSGEMQEQLLLANARAGIGPASKEFRNGRHRTVGTGGVERRNSGWQWPDRYQQRCVA